MHVLIAPDKFKDALTAQQACALIAGGVRAARSDWACDVCPITDGGEGFAPILTDAAGGRWIACDVTGPRGALVTAGFGLVETCKLPDAVRARLVGLSVTGTLAVIEMAAASGLMLLPQEQRDVWQTDTRGTGELMAAAVAAGADGILLGVGGSATHDLGLGALVTLGAVLKGEGAGYAPVQWSQVSAVDFSGLAKLPPVWIGCDVINPLLGPSGAAAVYAKQKGLPPAETPRLDAESARMAALMGGEEFANTPGAGAAGGIAFGLMVAAGARLVPGYDLVTDWLALDERLAKADLVITGEGRFDDSSLSGKGAGSLVRAARERGKPVHVFAGRVDLSTTTPGVIVHELSPRDEALAVSLASTGERLRERVAAVLLG